MWVDDEPQNNAVGTQALQIQGVIAIPGANTLEALSGAYKEQIECHHGTDRLRFEDDMLLD